MARIALLLLGSPRLERDGELVQVDTRKAIALIAYLAVTRQPHSRDSLVALLWPEYGHTNARSALRRTLSALNKAIEEEWLEVDRESVGLKRNEVWVDVKRFRGLLAECQTHDHRDTEVCSVCIPLLTEAVALCRGDFLAGFHLRDSPNFDDWQFFEAQSLRRELASALERLVRSHEARGEWELAIAYARRWLALDPLNEPAHRALMQLYAWADQRAAALRQYKECVRVLDKELGVHPVEETTRLYRSIKESEMLPQPVASQHQPPNHRATEGSENQILNEASPTTQSLEGLSDGHRQHNLPASRTSFVGRKRELADVKRELARTRLLTLTGAGGSGKTRLALEVAKDIVGDYSDGVWLVRLAGLSEPKLLPQEVATALGVHEQPNHSLVDTLVDHLQTKDLLLVLDNCEHLIDAAAHLIDAVLSGSQRQRVLATSREPLRVSGEIVRRVPSLSMPDPKDPVPSTEELARFEAAQLFLERVRSREETFELSDRNAQAVAEICWRLEGIPLAIELAAARIGVLSAEQIVVRLKDSLKLLTRGSRTVDPRHQTLTATLDWSHELLSELEKKLFRRLSVFAGGWTLEAAEEVGAGVGTEHSDVLELLSSLVDKSLVVVQKRGGEMRYRMLETVRQYGWEKLKASGEVEAIRRRHATFFLALAQDVEPKIEPKVSNADRLVWLEQLEIEHDNLRAALRWAVESAEAEAGLRLASALFWFWHMRGYLSEGRDWFEKALAEAPVRTAVRAKALYHAAYLAYITGDLLESSSQLTESVATWRKLGGRQGLARALWLLGLVMLVRGEPAVARSYAEESVEISRTVEEDDFGLSMVLAITGIIVLNQGDSALASSLLEESAAISREAGDDWALSLPLRYLGAAAFRRGDYDRAVLLFKESLTVLRESLEKWYVSRSLECLATVVAIQRNYERAARLFGAGEALREAIGSSQVLDYLVTYHHGVAVARAGLDDMVFERAWAEGRAMSTEEALAEALEERG